MCEQKFNLTHDANSNQNQNCATEPAITKCFISLAPETSFGLRINTLQSFYQANQQVCSHLFFVANFECIFFQIYNVFETVTNMPVSCLITKTCDVRSTQMAQTTVGEQSVIQEKTSINKSTIGASCKINSKVRLSDSILMDNVVIEKKY